MYGQLKISGGLARKFPMPESLKERALALFIIGLAFVFAGGFDFGRDYYSTWRGETAQAQLLKTIQYRKTGPKRNIGIYLYQDKVGSQFSIAGKKIYSSPKIVPRNVKVAWPLGNPNKARVLGEYDKRTSIAFLLMGFLLFGFSGFLAHKSKEAK